MFLGYKYRDVFIITKIFIFNLSIKDETMLLVSPTARHSSVLYPPYHPDRGSIFFVLPVLNFYLEVPRNNVM